MRRAGRSEDQDFDSDEKLFRRIKPSDFTPARRGSKFALSLYTVELPDVSVVREKYEGKPEYALYDDVNKVFYETWGICSVRVGQVPAELMDAGRMYTTKVRHAPHKENFHHSEIRLFDSGGRHIADKRHIPVELKRRWQLRMRSVMILEKAPE